jgi:DNA methylase
MTAARFLVGDVFERMAELEDHSVDLILTSPPFLALRSYLPEGHPDKAKEIGSEATPAAFLDTMLALTAEWRRLLAPHGSIAIEIGDTYSGSGGAGGDYNPGGLRDGQPAWKQQPGTKSGGRRNKPLDAAMGLIGTTSGERAKANPGAWPLPKSLALIPELYAASLAYGRNLLTGQPSPAGMWRIRNIKPWIRSNPPVGALGDKERPATSYVTVATIATDRYFDLDAVRTATTTPDTRADVRYPRQMNGRLGQDGENSESAAGNNPAGAPPLDWWHHADAVIDAEIDRRAGKVQRGGSSQPGADITPGRIHGYDASNNGGNGRYTEGAASVGARGVHIRRALENAGILTTHDTLDISPRGYAGAHYAVWPPELVRLLVDEMCPRHVCTTCGTPSRRITESDADAQEFNRGRREGRKNLPLNRPPNESRGDLGAALFAPVARTTLGWSDCGHGTWRPGHVLDPFVGSGTTLAVCTGMARTATGIDLDPRNADLARERVGMFLEIDWGPNGEPPPTPKPTAREIRDLELYGYADEGL